MKRLKIAILISLIIGALTIFVGCGGSNLAAPQQLDYNIENELSWDPVENARGYYVEIINVATGDSEKSQEVKRTSTKISLSFLEQGDYDIRVRALAKDKDEKTKWSETIHFQKGYETGCIYTLINDDSEYRLARYGVAPATIYIEDEYRGKPVTEIGQRAFKGYGIIENVEIGDNVRSIGDNAFYGCRNLKSVVFGDSVLVVGQSAFQSCNSLESVVVNEELVSIAGSAFNYCRALKAITLPEGLLEIGTYAFANCSALTEIILPDSLISLGAASFEANLALKKVTLGDGLTEIAASTFYRCGALETIVFPDEDNLKVIGNNAFRDCYKLTEVDIPEGVEVLSSYSFAMTLVQEKNEEGEYVVVVQSMLESVTLPSTLKTLGMHAFNGAKFYMDEMLSEKEDYIYVSNWIVGITPLLKANLEVISYDAFREDTIGLAEGALKGCEKLEKVYLPDSVRYLGGASLQSNLKLRIFETSDDSQLENIGAYALAGCIILSDVVLRGEALTTLEEGAFASCLRLNNTGDNILTPKSLKRIGKQAFTGTLLATEGIGADGLIYAGNWLVEHKKNATITSITIRENTVGIADYALIKCEDLAKVTFAEPGEFQYIGKGAFCGCYKLDRLDLSLTNVRRIEDYAFFRCTTLKSVDFPRLTSIGRAAFYYCLELTKVDLSKARVTEIGMNAFAGCCNLKELNLGDYLTEVGEGAFYQCNMLTEVTIPDSLTRISEYAFFGCMALEKVSFGANITEIATYAFTNCEKLQAVSFGDALKEIGDYAFYNCNGLLSVELNEGLESLGNYAFIGAEKLTSLPLPTTLKYIGKYALALQGALETVMLSDEVEVLGEFAFYGCDKLTIYVEGNTIPEGWGATWNCSYRPVIMGCTFVADDNGAYVASVTVGENSIENAWAPEDLTAPERAQHTFLGWATSPEGEVVYSIEALVNVPEGTTLYAVWKKM